MTLETETASTATGRNIEDSSDKEITRASDTVSESCAKNRVGGLVKVGHTGRGGHQGRGEQGGHFNRPAYT